MTKWEWSITLRHSVSLLSLRRSIFSSSFSEPSFAGTDAKSPEFLCERPVPLCLRSLTQHLYGFTAIPVSIQPHSYTVDGNNDDDLFFFLCSLPFSAFPLFGLFLPPCSSSPPSTMGDGVHPLSKSALANKILQLWRDRLCDNRCCNAC